MIISTITQIGLHLYADPEQIPFRFSGNLKMKFIRAPDYEGYNVMGYYLAPGEPESRKLKIDTEGIFKLNPSVFRKRGMLTLSFSLYKDDEIIHLGNVLYKIRDAIGETNATLPQDEKVWMELVRKEVDDYLKDYGGTIKIDFADKRDIEEIIEGVFVANSNIEYKGT